MKVIVTERAVFDVLPTGLMLRELFPGTDVNYVRGITEAEFEVSPNLFEMKLGGGSPSNLLAC